MTAPTPPPPLTPAASARVLALALSMGAAVSLGITRFSYGLLLPPMRADLGWSYALAGGMNTANAAGYLLGALVTPALMRRFGAVRLLVGGAVLRRVSSWRPAASSTSAPALLLQRLLAGLASAWVFVAGGLLAARLGSRAAVARRLPAGALLRRHGLRHRCCRRCWCRRCCRPPPGVAHGWAWAWWALALASVAATAVLALAVRAMPGQGCASPRRRGRRPAPAGAARGRCGASAGRWRAIRCSAPATSAT